MECVRGWFLPQTIHIVVPTMSSPITTQTITFNLLRIAAESSPTRAPGPPTPSFTCVRSREPPDGYYGPPGRERPGPAWGPDEARGSPPFHRAMVVP